MKIESFALLLAMLASPAFAGAADIGDGRAQALSSEAAAYLSDLVRIRTVNPPGGERAACDYLAGVLRLADIPFQVYESTPGRASIVARLKGTGAKKPILLISHLDTVGVEEALWSFPPFAGDMVDGYVRGRGAIDDKSMAAVFLTTILELKRSGAKLSRDVIFAATADEESGGQWGVRWLLERHPEALGAEFALNEGGMTQIIGGQVRLIAVQSAEKSYYDILLTARGLSGHASVPHPGNAIHMLGSALERVSSWDRGVRLNDVTRSFFSGVRKIETPSLRAAIEDVLSDEPEREERGRESLSVHPYYSAMLQDTVVPTMIQGGIRENVVASEAKLNLNVRLLPDSDPEIFLDQLSQAVDEPGVEISIASQPPGPVPEPMPASGPMYEALRTAAKRLAPEAIFVPSMSVGATDSEFLRRAGIATYGIEFPLTLQDESRIHGHDEKMPAASLGWGVRFVETTLMEVAK